MPDTDGVLAALDAWAETVERNAEASMAAVADVILSSLPTETPATEEER